MMNTTTTIPDAPPVVRWALGQLYWEARRRREFWRIYGADRAPIEYRPERDVIGARIIVREALAICRRNNWEFRAVCSKALEGVR